MQEFLDKVYSYDNFGIYLIIAIIVLIILFFVILFFGKKDKKNREIEETKRLQKLNPDLFKLEDNKEKVEVKEESVLEEVQAPQVEPLMMDDNEAKEEEIKPIINEQPVADKIPEITPVVSEEVEKPLNMSLTPEDVAPLLSKVEEPEIKLPELEEVKPVEIPAVEVNTKSVPDFNIDEITKGVEDIKEEQKEVPVMPEVKEEVKEEIKPVKGPEIFSSVYVPEKEEEPIKEESTSSESDNFDDEFEMPALKTNEEKVEPKLEELKEEQPLENVELNDYDLDSLTGETYNINR